MMSVMMVFFMIMLMMFIILMLMVFIIIVLVMIVLMMFCRTTPGTGAIFIAKIVETNLPAVFMIEVATYLCKKVIYPDRIRIFDVICPQFFTAESFSPNVPVYVCGHEVTDSYAIIKIMRT